MWLLLPLLLWRKGWWFSGDSVIAQDMSMTHLQISIPLKLARKAPQNVLDNINLIMKWYTSYNCHLRGEGQISWQVWIGISLLKSQNCCVTSEPGPISWAVFVMPLKSIPWRLRWWRKEITLYSWNIAWFNSCPKTFGFYSVINDKM